MTRLSKLSRSVGGRAALITGAACGMGRATAQLFADEGAWVAVTDINEAGAKTVAKEIADAGGHAHAWKLDMADGDEIKRVTDEAAEEFGRLDIIVNNAGLSAGAPLDAENYEEVWDRALSVMLTGQMRLVRAALPYLRQSDAGRIINIASTEALGATPMIAPYTAAKHGVIGLTRSLAVDLGKERITVNCVCPGAVHTGITAGISDEHKEIFSKRRIPVKRYAEPEEVAHMTLSIALPAMSYLNGAVIPVDGGLTIKNA